LKDDLATLFTEWNCRGTSLNFALAQKENTSFTEDMHVIFHINDILNVFKASLW